jgi:hypothetical protein
MFLKGQAMSRLLDIVKKAFDGGTMPGPVIRTFASATAPEPVPEQKAEKIRQAENLRASLFRLIEGSGDLSYGHLTKDLLVDRVEAWNKLPRFAKEQVPVVTQDGQNVFHKIARYGDADLFDLFHRGAPGIGDINAQDAYGNTPLHIARYHANNDVIDRLQSLRARPYIKNNEGLTPADMPTIRGKGPNAPRPAPGL